MISLLRWTSDGRSNLLRRVKLHARTIVPRVMWTVVERDGQPELVIWREWLGSAYDIVSLAGDWGRWNRTRIANGLSADEAPRVTRPFS